VNLKPYKDEVLLVPLGGANEIGMNLNLYHINGKWLMIDLGIGFADDYLPGIDIVLPDMEFVQDIRDDLVGLVLTHAHEDHLGAVPYLWDELGCDVYCTSFTSSVLKAKLVGEGLSGKIPIHDIEPGGELEVGPFKMEMVPLTHSIPEMQAIVLKTNSGVIVHTGDWKLDADPMVGEPSDIKRLKELGKDGVLAMVCDSTNVFMEGESGSEADVRKHVLEEVQKCDERVIISTFASNIARVDTILHAAQETGRKVVMVGRSLHRVFAAAKEAGYLDYPEDMFVSDRDAKSLPRSQMLVLCTGCQGEARAALSRMVQGSHPTLKLAAGDTVILSSKIIPGNETRIRWMYNQFVQRDIKVVTEKDAPIHVSGHPARDELKRMYEWVKPKVAVPVHGEIAHIREHANFARTQGVAQVVEAFNGAVIQLNDKESGVMETVHSGYVAMDGSSMISVNSPVIRQRRKIRDEGVITVSVVLSKDNDVIGNPQISAPGSLDADGDESLIVELQEHVSGTVGKMPPKSKMVAIRDKIRSIVRKIISKELGKKPVIEVHIHHV